MSSKALHVSPMGELCSNCCNIARRSSRPAIPTSHSGATTSSDTPILLSKPSNNLLSPQFGGYTQVTLDRTGDLVLEPTLLSIFGSETEAAVEHQTHFRSK